MKSNNRSAFKTLAFGCLIGAAAIAQSVTIWSYDNLGPTNAGTNGDRLIRFDSANPVGTVTTIGASGVGPGMSGLDYDAAGNLYSADGFGTGFSSSSLYRVNTTTGAATLVGNMGGNVVLTDMSWNPVLGAMQGVSGSGGLYTINLVNGAATLVGNIAGLPAGALLIGMSTNSAGVNYVHDIITDQMFVLAGLVAAPTSSTIGADTNYSQGMVMNWSGANEWFLGAIGFAPTGGFFSDVRLMNNVTGGTQTILGTWPTATSGLPEYETGDLAINPVPEPATMTALGLGLAALLRRRRK